MLRCLHGPQQLCARGHRYAGAVFGNLTLGPVKIVCKSEAYKGEPRTGCNGHGVGGLRGYTVGHSVILFQGWSAWPDTGTLVLKKALQQNGLREHAADRMVEVHMSTDIFEYVVFNVSTWTAFKLAVSFQYIHYGGF